MPLPPGSVARHETVNCGRGVNGTPNAVPAIASAVGGVVSLAVAVTADVEFAATGSVSRPDASALAVRSPGPASMTTTATCMLSPLASVPTTQRTVRDVAPSVQACPLLGTA